MKRNGFIVVGLVFSLLLAAPTVGAAPSSTAFWVATGEGSLEPMDRSEPMDWCMPAEVCVVEEAGRREAVFEFEADTETGLGAFTYTDHGVRYAGRKFSVTADVTEVEYNGLLPWHFEYYLRGTYQAKGGSAVPAGLFEGWFRWSSYSETPHVVIYLREAGGSGFSYMNQGQMTSGQLYHPDLEPSGPMYDLGTLGPSPAYYSNADAINNRGQVVGDSDAGAEWHLFLWEKGEMVDLGAPPWGTPDFVWPSAINEQGMIVGTLRTSEQPQSGFLYEGGKWTLIKTPDSWWSNAVDINNQGQILGDENMTGGDIEVFISEDGVSTYVELDLPQTGPFAPYVHPVALTERGDILGYYDDYGPVPGEPPLLKSFVWRNGEVELIVAPGGEKTQAFGMNARGQVVGQYYTAPAYGNTQAFIWEDGIMTDLPGLSSGPSGATAINNRGQIVGAAQTAEGDMHAVMWDNGEVIDLGTLGGSESVASDLNESGQIVGQSQTDYGAFHAFVWEPHN